MRALTKSTRCHTLVGNRIHWIARNIVVTILVGSALFATRNASAAQLTLDWVDNAGGTAYFTIERKTDIIGTYAPVATIPPGVTTYVDTTVVAGTTYCYHIRASNALAGSGYSNEACASPAAGFDLTVAKAGTGSGTVVSTPAGISCGGNCVATYAAGKIVTLAATPASDSSFTGWSGGGCAGTDPCVMAGNTPVTVTAIFNIGSTAPTASRSTVVSSPAMTLAYNGKLRDRVGQGDSALAPDGALDGTLTATLNAPGGRTITSLRLESDAPGIWDTTNGNGWWVLGVAATPDGTLLNAPGTMAINFPVADGDNFVVFASDYQASEFLPGRTLRLTATFADGSTATAVTTVPVNLTLAYDGKLRDRVGQGDMALGADGAPDGTLTATLNAAGGRIVTGVRLESNAPGAWDTSSRNDWWVLGVAMTLDGALLNASATMAVNFSVADGGSFVVFASDYQAGEFLPGQALTLTVTFADGSTVTAVITVR